ncbi:MAG: methyltransferase domain-containing protein [bacterium]
MFIVIYAGGMPFNGENFAQRPLGGSESAAYYLARELAARGHHVTLFTSDPAQGAWEGVRYLFHGPPSAEFPLGEAFHFYAGHTELDALIVQRHPNAFRAPWASKVNLWWLHDLALYRHAGAAIGQSWNLDGVLAVSEWHAAQVRSVYGFAPEAVTTITNGVDRALYEGKIETGPALEMAEQGGRLRLFYGSRPERGLENLVRPGGIMERLAGLAPACHLYVAGYDNTTREMEGYYRGLWERIDALANCTNLGALGKRQLADVQRASDAWVYPSTFEETSCISAMEAMAAGLPIVASLVGALPETCDGTGATLLPLRDGAVDIERWVSEIAGLAAARADDRAAHARQVTARRLKKAARRFRWPQVAAQVEREIERLLAVKCADRAALAAHLLHHSDIYALRRLLAEPENQAPAGLAPAAQSQAGADPAAGEEAGAAGRAPGRPGESRLLAAVRADLAACYGFAERGEFAGHYRRYYAWERERGVVYGPEELAGQPRYEIVAARVATLPAGSRVLDYGCAHGHFTVNLAKRFPALTFVGVDIEPSNIATAEDWAAADGVPNVAFFCGETLPAGQGPFAMAIAAEVLEHVADPAALADRLGALLEPGGSVLITTPAGPWEAQGYRAHHPWRAHLWHFERADLLELFGHHPDYGLQAVPQGLTALGERLGHHVVQFGKPGRPSGAIDWARKLGRVAPRQSLSLCMIVKDGEGTLRQTLDSVAGVVDEVIIGLDRETGDRTVEVIAAFRADYPGLPVEVLSIPSPLKTGFAAARNLTIDAARCQWILWLDADEALVGAEALGKYLRHNGYLAYSLQQHHFAVEPAMVMKTDRPAKLFRNGRGIRFYGLVHEHPELAINEGLSQVLILSDVVVAHNGYLTEAVRRRRFARNIRLMERDRAENPGRVLGRFLWMRDLALLNRYDAETNGGRISPAMRARSREGIAIWRALLAEDHLRMCIDGLDHYSQHTQLLGGGFDFSAAVEAAKRLNGGPPAPQTVAGHFASREDAGELMKKLVADQTGNLDNRYF